MLLPVSVTLTGTVPLTAAGAGMGQYARPAMQAYSDDQETLPPAWVIRHQLQCVAKELTRRPDRSRYRIYRSAVHGRSSSKMGPVATSMTLLPLQQGWLLVPAGAALLREQ